jgi:hypothetical protein
MPGPGQGKRAHKKKWRDNARNAATTCATTTTTVPTTTDTAAATAIDANDATCIDTATAASSNDATLQPQQFTYTHEEVRVLLQEARSDGWEEGRMIGYEDGLEDGKDCLEDAKTESYREGREAGYKEARLANGKVEVQKYEEGQSEGIARGLQAGEHDERQKWLAEGHGHGLCLSMAAHACELF